MSGTKNQKSLEAQVFGKLLDARRIFLSGEVSTALAHQIIAQLMYLEVADPKAPITLYINSPGGEVDAGLAIYDVLRSIKPPVETVSTGLTASIATIILVGAARGRRRAYPNARILIHQPLGGVHGQATDIEIHAEEILKTKRRVSEILARETGQAVEKILRDTNRDYWMSAEEAMAYGIIDEIIAN